MNPQPTKKNIKNNQSQIQQIPNFTLPPFLFPNHTTLSNIMSNQIAQYLNNPNIFIHNNANSTNNDQNQNQTCCPQFTIITNNFFIETGDAISKEANIENINDANYKKNHEDFNTIIKKFVQHLESIKEEQSIVAMANPFKIGRRKLYDIVIILDAIGCCKKNNADWLAWIGYNNIKKHFEELIKEKNINNYDLSLDQLFPVDDCMGLSNITIYFILLFYALKTDHLGIHCAARFLTRNTYRYKKTLTKILVIEKILTAIDLMCKAAQNDEVLLATKDFQLEIVPEINDQSQTNVGSINSFLNNEKSIMNDAIIQRRKEFESFNKVKKNT